MRTIEFSSRRNVAAACLLAAFAVTSCGTVEQGSSSTDAETNALKQTEDLDAESILTAFTAGAQYDSEPRSWKQIASVSEGIVLGKIVGLGTGSTVGEVPDDPFAATNTAVQVRVDDLFKVATGAEIMKGSDVWVEFE